MTPSIGGEANEQSCRRINGGLRRRSRFDNMAEQLNLHQAQSLHCNEARTAMARTTARRHLDDVGRAHRRNDGVRSRASQSGQSPMTLNDKFVSYQGAGLTSDNHPRRDNYVSLGPMFHTFGIERGVRQ